VRAALAEDADLLTQAERADIDTAVLALEAALSGSDHRAIKAAIKRANRVTDPFAARRMDRSVKQALAGRDIASM
jgi:molecular chaperone HscA